MPLFEVLREFIFSQKNYNDQNVSINDRQDTFRAEARD
jgi:hypothetical protein